MRKRLQAQFGKQLKQLRERRGLSQEELAFQAGVHPTYVSQIERGLKSPTLHIIFRLSQVLGYKAAKLVALVERRL